MRGGGGGAHTGKPASGWRVEGGGGQLTLGSLLVGGGLDLQNDRLDVWWFLCIARLDVWLCL